MEVAEFGLKGQLISWFEEEKQHARIDWLPNVPGAA